MKKVILLLTFVTLSAAAAFSQSYIVVNSDTIFRSIDEYNRVVDEIDAFAQEKQQTIDEAFSFIETQFNDYIANRASMTEEQRLQAEARITDNENRAIEFQESIFGQDGELARMRRERIEPIQTNVLNLVVQYASQNNLGMVIDIATNPIIIYFDPSLDRTEEIIRLLK